MRYYVYALIDPTDGNNPFYIGKGMDGRLQSHFKRSMSGSSDTGLEIVGCDTKSILFHAEGEGSAKKKRIDTLLAQGFDHTSIARIVARRLSETTALTVEAFFIKSVCGVGQLTNRVEGGHSERFRPYDVWERIDDFDLGKNENRLEDHLGRYYVYVLRNPESGEVFYVGKGTCDRALAHFSETAGGNNGEGHEVEKRDKIFALKERGFGPRDIVRIMARLSEEDHAFAIESLLIKFVYGLSNLTNLQVGHHSGLYRAKGDWSIRKGFDLPFVVAPGTRADRSEKLDEMLGEGLDGPLHEIARSFPQLEFDPPRVLDASDLSIEADVGQSAGETGSRLKIFIRRRRIQIELRPRNKAQREWVVNHFSRLNAYPLRRRDDVFFPDQWKGPGNMTDDTVEAVRRVRLMLEIVSNKGREELSPEAEQLLPRTG